MQNSWLALFLLLISITTSWSQTGTSISAKISDAPSRKVLLAYYHGDKQYIKDSSYSDSKGNIAFNYPEKLESGIYMLYFPQNENKTLEFVLESDQQFSFQGNLSDSPKSIVFTGSEDNTLFYSYLNKIQELRTQYEKLNKRLENFKSLNLNDSINAVNKEIDALSIRKKQLDEQQVKDHPNAFLAKLLNYQYRPEIPETIVGQNERIYYYRSHFFDRIDWNFAAIVRTSALHALLKEYIENLTFQEPDSLIMACNLLLEKAQVNNAIFQYTLTTLVNKFANIKYAHDEEVYVYLVDNYYTTGKAFWVTTEENKEQLTRMKQQADKLRPAIRGSYAYNFSLPDANGKKVELKKLTDKYILLFFWWSNEKNNLIALRELSEIADLMQLKGVKPVGVPKANDRERWEKEIDALEVDGMIHLWPESKEEYNSIIAKYNAKYYPNFFVLDKDLKIVFKSYSLEALNSYLYTLPNK